MSSTFNPQLLPHNLQFIHRLLLGTFVAFLIFSGVLNSVNVQALPASFDNGLTLTNSDFYYLPDKFNSVQKIQTYLEKNSSYLATHKAEVSFEPEDRIIKASSYGSSVASNLQPPVVLSSFLGKEMPVSEIIWNLSRNNFGNGCNLDYLSICIDNSKKPINPGFILALIQKESGLVYGKCNNVSTENTPECPQSVQFRLDRVVGYFCFENPDKTKSCYDENPNWKYFKGFFRQVYYAARLLRLRELSCELGGKYAFSSGTNIFTVGSKVKISEQEFILKNAITCALYIYTPHISSQRLLWSVLKQIGAGYTAKPKLNLDKNYRPFVLTN